MAWVIRLWDPSSPAFIMEIGHGKTLCIPTAICFVHRQDR
ncbi:MAG: glutamine synthetase III [Ferruginibacter sp.]